MQPDRRAHPRSRLLRRGRIVFRDGYCSADCVVMDISTGGALLKFAGLIGLPETFELRLDSGIRRRAEVRYRTHETMGVRFADIVAAE
jgi:hypothetical protein